MPNYGAETTGTPPDDTPEGFEAVQNHGHDCLTCGAWVRQGRTSRHREWHETSGA